MAPEVLEAGEAGAYTYKADSTYLFCFTRCASDRDLRSTLFKVYSFGIILYEMVTLLRPYEDVPHYLVDQKVVRGERPRVPNDLESCYQPFISLFNSCTELAPDDRPTIRELKDILISSL